jgi:hypothetical protein
MVRQLAAVAGIAIAAGALAGQQRETKSWTGTLRDSRGRGLADAVVYLQAGPERALAKTVQDGRFTFAGLAAGSYSIQVERAIGQRHGGHHTSLAVFHLAARSGLRGAPKARYLQRSDDESGHLGHPQGSCRGAHFGSRHRPSAECYSRSLRLLGMYNSEMAAFSQRASGRIPGAGCADLLEKQAYFRCYVVPEKLVNNFDRCPLTGWPGIAIPYRPKRTTFLEQE